MGATDSVEHLGQLALEEKGTSGHVPDSPSLSQSLSYQSYRVTEGTREQMWMTRIRRKHTKPRSTKGSGGGEVLWLILLWTLPGLWSPSVIANVPLTSSGQRAPNVPHSPVAQA